MTKEEIKNRVQSEAWGHFEGGVDDMVIKVFNMGVDAAMHGHGSDVAYKSKHKDAYAKGHAAFLAAVASA